MLLALTGMRSSTTMLGLLIGFAMTLQVAAGDITIKSGPARVPLLELYTSEGCSSCPPAERWLSTLRQSDRLWKDVVPVSFHVDYWDHLGWKDDWASKLFTARQRAYSASWGTDTIYTPEFVLNGREWRASSLDALPRANADAGLLTASLQSNGAVNITYTPPNSSGPAKLRAHVALLGLEVKSDVKAGENSGRKLVHDFVVLMHQSENLVAGEAGQRVRLQLPVEKARPGQSAFAVWITADEKPEPLQAAGGGL